MRYRTLAAAVLLSLSSAAEGGVREFVASHCVACHDSAGREAGLDLEAAEVSLSSKANGFLWESVFDRVDRGEMPPKTADQPTPEERAAFLAELGHELRTASLARQAKEGRGPVRRLGGGRGGVLLCSGVGVCVCLGRRGAPRCVSCCVSREGSNKACVSACSNHNALLPCPHSIHPSRELTTV